MPPSTTTQELLDAYGSSGRSIRDRRRKLGLTQSQCALLAQCSATYVGLIERGYSPTRNPVAYQRVLDVLQRAEDEGYQAPIKPRNSRESPGSPPSVSPESAAEPATEIHAASRHF